MIRTYANTVAELNSAQLRLDLLMRRKEELYTKYFPQTSKIDEASAHTNKKSDPMADYVAELTKISTITGMSLEQEIDEARNEKDILRYYVKLMEENLENTTGRTNELFRLIIIHGYNPAKAVDKIAEKYKKEPRTIWEYDYSKIKKEIDKCSVKVQ